MVFEKETSYKMNPNHYFDKKIFKNNINEIKQFDLNSYLKKVKAIFNDFSFLVISDNKILYSDIGFAFSITNDILKIIIARLIHKKLYIVHNHNGNTHVKLDINQGIELIHDNIAHGNQQSLVEIISHKKLVYTHIIQNTDNDIFYQDLKFNHYKESNIYFLQNNNISKNKINQKHLLINLNSQVIIRNINQLIEKQLRDDFIEIEHIESQTKSDVSYLVLNGGKCVSQINSIIGKDAFDSETHQHIKHLLVGDNSQSFSKPNLMIENPTVVASHGNSIGSYSEEELFYIMQKGISLERAKNIIQNGLLVASLQEHPQSQKILNYFIGDL